jgi:DNA-binding ferritin-like protein (Dps family)
MRITRRQLRRIIKEEKRKLINENENLSSNDELYFSALERVEETMFNAAMLGVDKGLILDDIVDAWESVLGRIEYELEVK